MTINDFTIGDVLEITSRNRVRGEERRTAVVSCIDHNGNGLVTYVGHQVDGRLTTGSGAFDPSKLGAEYGLVVAVRKIGRYTEPRPWYPKRGMTGYDPC